MKCIRCLFEAEQNDAVTVTNGDALCLLHVVALDAAAPLLENAARAFGLSLDYARRPR